MVSVVSLLSFRCFSGFVPVFRWFRFGGFVPVFRWFRRFRSFRWFRSGGFVSVFRVLVHAFTSELE